MAGADHKTAPIELREKIAFTEDEIKEITRRVCDAGAAGCVLLCTCNRTELYISSEKRMDAARLLFGACGADYAQFRGYIRELYDFDAAEHIVRVACGLHSAILCEEQIVTQVGDAVRLSRDIGCSDAVLNTLFRLAVTAGKKALTEFSVTGVPASAAQAAAQKAEELFGSLRGRRALVIGNGKMGILAAESLINKGCAADITLRRYKHGDNIVPDGAGTIEFKARREAFGNYDIIVTATRSPHYTVDVKSMAALSKRPEYVFDLAVPRDAEPGIERYVKCFTIDDLCTQDTDTVMTDGVRAIARGQAEEFRRWKTHRERFGKR